VNVGEYDGVRCSAGVSKDRAEIILKMEALFSFETKFHGLSTPQNLSM